MYIRMLTAVANCPLIFSEKLAKFDPSEALYSRHVLSKIYIVEGLLCRLKALTKNQVQKIENTRSCGERLFRDKDEN